MCVHYAREGRQAHVDDVTYREVLGRRRHPHPCVFVEDSRAVASYGVSACLVCVCVAMSRVLAAEVVAPLPRSSR